MSGRRITRAVVLAAGMGTRLNGHGGDCPKPLRRVSGVALLVRVLRTLQDVGIREAVIVVGHQGAAVRRALLSEPSLGLELTFVQNDAYKKKNGVSLLAAADYVEKECLLTMSDHLFSPDLPRRLMMAELPGGACALGVDFDLERCFDLDDATKVRTQKGRIAAIGKELPVYDAIDTGIFRIGPRLIEVLAELHASRGDCSLSEGVQLLAERGEFFACDVGDARWIDVDTSEAMERAEAMLRVFGDGLGDEPGESVPAAIDPESIESFAPTWVRAARPYKEGHFAIADDRSGIVRLMSNEGPFGPTPRVLQAIVEAAMRSNLYPDSGRGVREKLARREGLEEQNVLLGAGSTELIDVVIRTFVGPGEEVLLSVPTFSMYEARTRVVGGIPVLVPMNEDAQPDVAKMIRSVTERTKVIFLCTPNNPTGMPLCSQELLRIVRLGLPTVIDEAYWELGEQPSFSYLLREYPNVIVLRTLSKGFGLAGLRLGYAFAHQAVIQLLSRVKVPWNLPSITLAAASAALEDAEQQDARVNELKRARAELASWLSALPGLAAVPSEGNFVMVDISGTAMTSQELVAAVLSEGVLIRSLEVHHATKHFVRVTVGTRSQNARCVEAISQVISRRTRPWAPEPMYESIASDAE